MANRAVSYTRVSSEEQLDGYSLSAQDIANKAFITQRGWTHQHTYEERGRSGKTVLRPEFQQMMKDAESGLFDTVVVHKLDRFSRSLLDMLVYLKKLKDLNISLVSASEDFDFTTPIGKVILAVLASFAEWYLDNLKTEIIKGKRERVRQGYHNGHVSFGYVTPKQLRIRLLQIGDDFKHSRTDQQDYSRIADLYENAIDKYSEAIETAAVPDPLNAEAVRKAFDWYSSGLYSAAKIAIMLTRDGYRILEGKKGRTLITQTMIEEVLLNRFYLGETSYGARVPGAQRAWYPGNHEAIVSTDVFNLCQRVRLERGEAHVRAAENQRTYPLTPIVFCIDCGQPLTGWKGEGIHRYRDTASRKGIPCVGAVKSIRANTLEARAESLLRVLRLPNDWKTRVDKQPFQTQQTRDTQRATLDKRLTRLKTLFVMGDIDEDEYTKMRDAITGEMRDPGVHSSPVSIAQMYQAGEFLDNLNFVLDGATNEEKRELFRAVFRRIYTRNGDIVAIEPTPVMSALLHTAYYKAGRTGVVPNLHTILIPSFSSLEDVQRLVS